MEWKGDSGVARALPAAILILALISCGSPRELSHTSLPMQENYPRWFVQTPTGEAAHIAVGYSPLYARIEASYRQACENAIMNLAKSHRVRIRGGQAFLGGREGISYQGSNYVEEVDSVLVDNLRSTCVFLDTAAVGETILVLASTAQRTVDDETLGITHRPSWLDERPTGQDVLYAVGSAPTYLREASSWLAAERGVRIELARVRETQFQGLARRVGNDLCSVTVEEVDVVLENARIVSRHVDSETGTHYVLARCSK